MPFFKQSQYQIITAVVNRIGKTIEYTETMTETELDVLLCKAVTKVTNLLVDELCIEFAKDNTRFNETLFRAQCGNLISNEHIIFDAKTG